MLPAISNQMETIKPIVSYFVLAAKWCIRTRTIFNVNFEVGNSFSIKSQRKKCRNWILTAIKLVCTRVKATHESILLLEPVLKGACAEKGYERFHNGNPNPSVCREVIRQNKQARASWSSWKQLVNGHFVIKRGVDNTHIWHRTEVGKVKQRRMATNKEHVNIILNRLRVCEDSSEKIELISGRDKKRYVHFFVVKTYR